MNYSLKIGLAEQSQPEPIVASRTLTIGARLFAKLFGRKRVVIIVPGGSVESINITEKETANHDGS